MVLIYSVLYLFSFLSSDSVLIGVSRHSVRIGTPTVMVFLPILAALLGLLPSTYADATPLTALQALNAAKACAAIARTISSKSAVYYPRTSHRHVTLAVADVARGVLQPSVLFSMRTTLNIGQRTMSCRQFAPSNRPTRPTSVSSYVACVRLMMKSPG